ncbi:cobalt-zinc-cadmium efflux system membrane fusion protein [Comamonas odontotermitis]|uniref:Cobalt-zinc-cadmium efflux system membrane fusion protein n=1 Tax=Comamonas odontotermitis TaxID=379895 RepID=A0ABR6RG20_9BURK|nr:efflux RND transporter periplasmic adaptor subunit [Comamonas odontotermitis]MBB6578100.1 cobalt-zinc-cadmium efflux system membrane fusion protein [Comamonas odontotermitis]
MSEKTKFDTSLSSSRQWIVVAAILATGMVGGALILRPATKPSQAQAQQAGHTESHAHGDGEHHGESPAPEKAHQDADQHQDGEHHEGEAKKPAQAVSPKTEEAGHGDKEEEGHVKLSPVQAKAAGIVVVQADAASIRKEMVLSGEIRFDEDRTAHVVPRVPGVVASVHAQLGERVAKGQLLAVVQSAAVSDQRSELQTAQKRLSLARTTYDRERKLWEERISAEQDYQQARASLQEAEIAVANASQKLASIGAGAGGGGAGGFSRYELRAPLAGVVVEKHLTVGESVAENTASFTISDMSSVWAEMNVSAPQLPFVRVGSPVTVRATAFDSSAEGRVAYVGALIGEQTRTAPARVALANPQGVWRPGLFVDVKVLAEESQVPIAVDAKAIQQPDGKESVVFVPTDDGYKAQVVQVGRSDGRLVEIKSGLKAGQAYVRDGSFMLKAEMGKASAEHAH